MRFVIRDNKQKEKDVEVELSLLKDEDGSISVMADEYALISFKNGKFNRPECIDTVGIETDGNGRILEYE